MWPDAFTAASNRSRQLRASARLRAVISITVAPASRTGKGPVSHRCRMPDSAGVELGPGLLDRVHGRRGGRHARGRPRRPEGGLRVRPACPGEGPAGRLAPARGEVARDHARVGPAARRAGTGTAAARAEKTAVPAAAAALLLATTPAGADAPR